MWLPSITNLINRVAGLILGVWVPWVSVCRQQWGYSLQIRMLRLLVLPAKEYSNVHSGAFHVQSVSLPLKIIMLNNRYLGMVRQWQQFSRNCYAESYMDALPDFIKLAEAYGHVGIRVEHPSDGSLR